MKTWSAVHSWTSLVSTLFLLMLCVTGLPLIFASEIEHAFDPALAAQTGARAPLDAMVAAAKRARIRPTWSSPRSTRPPARRTPRARTPRPA